MRQWCILTISTMNLNVTSSFLWYTYSGQCIDTRNTREGTKGCEGSSFSNRITNVSSYGKRSVPPMDATPKEAQKFLGNILTDF